MYYPYEEDKFREWLTIKGIPLGAQQERPGGWHDVLEAFIAPFPMFNHTKHRERALSYRVCSALMTLAVLGGLILWTIDTFVRLGWPQVLAALGIALYILTGEIDLRLKQLARLIWRLTSLPFSLFILLIR